MSAAILLPKMKVFIHIFKTQTMSVDKAIKAAQAAQKKREELAAKHTKIREKRAKRWAKL